MYLVEKIITHNEIRITRQLNNAPQGSKIRAMLMGDELRFIIVHSKRNVLLKKIKVRAVGASAHKKRARKVEASFVGWFSEGGMAKSLLAFLKPQFKVLG